jgi:HemY protein
MIRALSLFLLLLTSVWLGVQLQEDPGYLLITINHWTIESTLWVAVIGLFVAFIILHALLLLLHAILCFPTTWSRWSAKRRSHHAQSKTRQGLIEFSEGHWLQAKNHLIKALPDTDTPLLNYLTAARAAQEMGDHQLRDDYLREAQQSMPEAKIAVELTQAQLQLANQQWEQALATLRHLQDLAPRHPYVLKLLRHLYEELKDWPQLIQLLPELKKHKVISMVEHQQLQQHAYVQAMLDLIKQDQAQPINNFLHQLPKNLTHDCQLMTVYSRYLLSKHRDAEAETLLKRCLRKQFDEQLIDLYGQINSNDAQLPFAESLLKEHAHSAALYVCLGKAKIYFEKSIELRPLPTAYIELGELLAQLGDHTGASFTYHQGLLLASEKNNDKQLKKAYN